MALVFEKNLRALIYPQLHTKSYDYQYKITHIISDQISPHPAVQLPSFINLGEDLMKIKVPKSIIWLL